MGDKISIIIPMYKAEEYIRRCIASIEAQTYTNWEAIFVEDGSSDRCGEICEAYAKNDKRIRVIHKKNEGVAVARNIGISNATGEYITFIDSDDYVHAKYLEHLIKLQKKYNADLVMVGYVLSYGSVVKISYPCAEVEMLDRETAIEKMLENQQLCSPWAKLYSKYIFNKIEYPKGAIYEDLNIAFELFETAKKIVYQNIPLYYYFQGSQSITRTSFHYGKLEETRALKKQYMCIAYHFPRLKEKAKYKYLYNVYGYIMCLVKAEDLYGKQKYKEFCQILTKNSKCFMQNGSLERKQRIRCKMIKHPKIYRLFYKLTGKV